MIAIEIARYKFLLACIYSLVGFHFRGFDIPGWRTWTLQLHDAGPARLYLDVDTAHTL